MVGAEVQALAATPPIPLSRFLVSLCFVDIDRFVFLHAALEAGFAVDVRNDVVEVLPITPNNDLNCSLHAHDLSPRQADPTNSRAISLATH